MTHPAAIVHLIGYPGAVRTFIEGNELVHLDQATALEFDATSCTPEDTAQRILDHIRGLD